MKLPVSSFIVMCALLLSTTVQSQTKHTVIKKPVSKQQPVKKLASKPKPSPGTLKLSTLNSSSDYAAKNDSAQGISRLSISDPIVKGLSDRAKGYDVKLSSSGIVGMPKGSYGFANGRISFYNSGSTSTGGLTGVGTVGTGSGLGSIGSNNWRGSNGKSLYAGTSMWGNARNLDIRRDSSTRSVGP